MNGHRTPPRFATGVRLVVRRKPDLSTDCLQTGSKFSGLYVGRSIRARISSTRHAVMRGPSLIGLGKRPLLTPAHHVERPTGMGPLGARIELSRTNPVWGK